MARPLQRLVGRLPPPSLLALLYLVLVLLGTGLLMLPAAQAVPVRLNEAFFTSASAVTVTGLIVVDPGTSFTIFGQAVIAVLIQLGGLGLMTFAALLLVTLGISIGMPQRIIMGEELGTGGFRNLLRLARLILMVAVVAEVAGTALLMLVFVPEMGWATGTWSALFHAVSAFNNAGFSLFDDSLVRHGSEPLVLLPIAALFIIGGIGFVVLGEIWQKRAWSKLSLHSKLMLTGTGALLLVSWALIGALEWGNPATLGAMEGSGDRLLAAFFQSATPRTAGFNALDTAALTDASTVLVMGLMFVGGGPTSTAGGIKVTTALVLILATRAFFLRHDTLSAFGRSIGLDEVMKVMALATISVGMVFLAWFVLAAGHEGEMFDLLFEVVSAFGTVGLSRGATADLDIIGQVIVACIMFLGRVGPLTLGFFLATRSSPRIGYPRGQIYLG
ncbi:TrkH family potassium uptake protein [Roseisalinus antarcticus]|uniref:Ktr system potassium uptake protein B n=1 Tax=Roseisalinus antarcticus TaxID=254357 RepID=A0A1Y5SC57_9RHOB|nr:potassium transporter TrkG [Roseisalinus antarcticus]SLN36278.1 Ktr system potassium uptake protein B [Roseisalinus antarcticus]